MYTLICRVNDGRLEIYFIVWKLTNTTMEVSSTVTRCSFSSKKTPLNIHFSLLEEDRNNIGARFNAVIIIIIIMRSLLNTRQPPSWDDRSPKVVLRWVFD